MWCLMPVILVPCRLEAGRCLQAQSQPDVHSSFPGHPGLDSDILCLETNKTIWPHRDHLNFLYSLQSVLFGCIAQWVVEHMLTRQRPGFGLQHCETESKEVQRMRNFSVCGIFIFCRSGIETHIHS